MSRLFAVPSPASHPLEMHPARRRPLSPVTRKAATLATAQGHPVVYDHERESCLPTVALAVSTLEASLIVRALAQSSSAASRELGERIDADVRARYVVDTDPTPARGTVRP